MIVISTDYWDNQAGLKHSNWKIMVKICPCWNQWKIKSEATFAKAEVVLGVFCAFCMGVIWMGGEEI